MSRTLVSLVSLASLLSCTTWHAQPLQPEKLFDESKTVRVTRIDGTQLVLEHAFFTGDSVRGSAPLTTAARPERRPVAIALRDVKELAIRKTDAGRTALLILGLVAGSWATFAVVCQASDCLNFDINGTL